MRAIRFAIIDAADPLPLITLSADDDAGFFAMPASAPLAVAMAAICRAITPLYIRATLHAMLRYTH